MHILEHKLNLVKGDLKYQEKVNYIPPHDEKEKLKSKLEKIQTKLENEEITPQIREEEAILQKKYTKVVWLEEEYWRLTSRSLWLKSGDRNTNFFHKQAKVRLVKNKVK